MRKVSVFSVAAVGLASVLGMSGGALADGVPAQYAAPVVLTPTTWTGLYVGVQGGYAESDIDWTLPVAQFFGAAGRGFSADDEDVVLGGHATYMYQMGPFVVGGDVAYNATWLEDNVVGPIPPFANDSFQTRIDDYATVTGRLGFAMNNWLIYADGGYATGKVKLHVVSGPPGAGVIEDTDRRHDGWTYGGGFSYMIHPNVVLGLDYEHVELDGERHEAISTGVAGVPFSIDSGDVELDTVTARLSIKLDREIAPAPLK
jgi:outer membrane immunogenic protein